MASIAHTNSVILEPSRTVRRRRAPADQLLTSRDIEVMRWLAEQYAARIDHVQALLGCGERQCQRILARQRAHGLVTWRRVLADEVAWVTPTSLGMRLSDTGFRVWPPSVALLRHVAAVNDVRLHVERHAPEGVWTSERLLAQEMGTQGHLPDAVFQLDGKSIAIEVELSRKSERRLKGILSRLSSEYDAILYYTSTGTRKQLSELAESGRWQKLGVRDLPTIVGDPS